MRYHSLDALRAVMMLLGLVLHSAASYTANPLGEAWPYQDRSTTVVFDLLLFFIHLFRMPVFFVAAGFFGALLYERDGAGGFIRNRARRVGLPLVIFWVTVLPLVFLSGAIGVRMGIVDPRANQLADQPFWRLPILGHLWFLYDLLIFYAVAWVVAPAFHAGTALFRLKPLITGSWWAVLLLGLVSGLTILPMQVPGIDTSAALLPPLRILVAYGVFFAFGWILYRGRQILEVIAARWLPYTIAGVLSAFAYLVVVQLPAQLTPRTYHVASAFLGGIAVWLLIFAFLGGFVRFLDAPRPAVRYLADASYWMYLTHLLPVIWTVGLLARAPWPAGVKFAIVLTATAVLTTLTYHWGVRRTAIGVLLNGRRRAGWKPVA